MNLGQTVFAQLMDFIPAHEFRRCVERYRGNCKVSSFSCWDQFLCMAFAQLTYRESLRDIETCLRALGPRLDHAGIRGAIARSTLADANELRDWRIYADLAQVLIATAAAVVRPRKFRGGVVADRLRAGLHDHRPFLDPRTQADGECCQRSQRALHRPRLRAANQREARPDRRRDEEDAGGISVPG